MCDFTKVGTDIIDQTIGFYTCKPKSRKCTITVFSYVIDIARVNWSTTFAFQKKYDPCKQDAFEYCYILWYQLVKPFIPSRSLNGLTTLVRPKIELVIGKKQWEVKGETVGLPTSEDKVRCHICISNLAGVGHKLKKNQMYRVKTLRRICKKHPCKDHLIATCKICLEHQEK